ncbi:MAG: heme exporter protein CcmB [Acidobacteria bacterium]|nr:heme exporter protein CcmB [Acidobacteriota bacterium]
MSSGLQAAIAILKKDLLLEFRGKEGFLSNLFFGLMVLLLFTFAFDPSSEALRQGKAAIFWIAVAFASVLTLNRTFQRESADRAIDALALLPVDPAWIFLGKFLGNLALITLLMLLIFPLFMVFFNLTVTSRFWLLSAVCLLTALGLSCVGTLFAAMAESSRLREVVLSIMMYPITIPVLIAAVQLTQQAIKLTGEIENWHWLTLLLIFDAIFLAAALVIFDYVLGE